MGSSDGERVDPRDLYRLDLPEDEGQISTEGASLLGLLSQATGPGETVTWKAATDEDLRASLLRAMDKIRNEVTYEPSCGSPDRPHLVHPDVYAHANAARLTGRSNSWVPCANCGGPVWLLRE